MTASSGPWWVNINRSTVSLAWQDEALCREVDPEIFFPEKGGTPAPAKKVCAKCHVIEECFAYAMRQGPGFTGVLAGTTQHERWRLQQKTHGPTVDNTVRLGHDQVSHEKEHSNDNNRNRAAHAAQNPRT